MTNFELATIGIIFLQIIILPWGAFITIRSFDHEKNIAVQKSVSSETIKQLEKLDKELNDLKDEIKEGFKEVMTKLNK